MSNFEKKYDSVSRVIKTFNAETALRDGQKPLRLDSKKAYLDDAHNQKRFVEDGGVTHLIFMTKKQQLSGQRRELRLSKKDVYVDVNRDRRIMVLKDLYVRLHAAHNRWQGIHETLIFQGFSNPELHICAKKMEFNIIKKVDTLGFSSSKCDEEMYQDKAKMIM